MATKIFVNLPVKDLRKSVEFFTKLDFTFNPQFTDETATCMIVSEDSSSCCWLMTSSKLYARPFVTRRKARSARVSDF